MGRAAAAFVMLVAAAGPAAAAGTLECASPEGDASIGLTIGSLPVLAVNNASIAADGTNWQLGGEGAGAVAVGQAFRDATGIRVDFTDPNIEEVLIEVRLFTASEGRETSTAGTLRIFGHGAWPLICTGP